MQERRMKSLRSQIDRLKNENRGLSDKITAYQERMAAVEEVRAEYERCIAEITQVKEQYREAVAKARDMKNEYACKFKELIRSLKSQK